MADADSGSAATIPHAYEQAEGGLLLSPGEMVGNYRVVGPLGRGGTGAVFEAIHQHIGRRAAIKVLFPEFSNHPRFMSRFLNEARAVNVVRHPGLVEIFEFGMLPNGAAYLIMELLEGESLAARIERAAGRPLPDALGLARQIAAALVAAHAKGIVHRDLKPPNVMIIPDPARPGKERIKILDFGLAKVRAAPGTPANVYKTRDGAKLGTPEYMAPEQCLGVVDVDGKADVYSLGVILYEMLAGRLPFVAKLSFDLMALHVRAAPPPLRQVNPAVSVETSALVHRMLAKRATDRPAMTLCADALERLEERAGRP